MTKAQAKKRVLFVCHQNQVRSRTAEQVYRSRPDLEVKSAGVAEHAAVPLTEDLLDWADLVFVFSKRQKQFVEARFGDRCGPKRLVCLGLPDRFNYKGSDLVSRLAGKLGPYLGPPVDDQWRPTVGATEPRSQEPASARAADMGSVLGNALSRFSTLFSGAKTLRAEPSA